MKLIDFGASRNYKNDESKIKIIIFIGEFSI
jgi:hypothetical protein